MGKINRIYVCDSCGASAAKWQGQCPDCGRWNSLTETRPGAGMAGETAVEALSVLVGQQGEVDQRYATGFREFDRVLGGGLVPGSVVLLGGDPGVGKSTLLLQVGAAMPAEINTLYVSGEESTRQIADRAARLGAGDAAMVVCAETRVEQIIHTASVTHAGVIVIDSIQTMTTADVASAPGSVTQLRECVAQLVRYAKQKDVTVLLIGHVTKEGVLAGPRVVEHMVDTVLYFENDPGSRYSIVRAVKNRFGASNELGMFAMAADGFREVTNPSAMFLSRGTTNAPGSVVTVAWEGSRPLLIEVQGLVSDCASGQPRRLAIGMDQNRLALLLAVLQRHGGVSLAGDDVFLNVVGGIRITEPAVDLAAVLAAVSSFRDRPVGAKTVSFGELGLAGEVRPVRFGEERLREAAKQGYRQAIVPKANMPRQKIDGMDVLGVAILAEALEAAS